MTKKEAKIAAKKQLLVSIVTPVHNGKNFIGDTVRTVCGQTYTNWEWIVVDDKSDDETVELIKETWSNLKDKGLVSGRLHLIQLKKNGGAARARNAGIREAKGKYLCFLDADDLWKTNKIAKQVSFMQNHGCAFSFTGYEFTDATGKPNGKIVSVPDTITYNQALRNTTIWTSTVMFDTQQLSYEDVLMPDVRRGQDTATWWKVLKKVDCAYGLNEVLSYYRRSAGSLSSNKLTALKRTWNLYRNVEHLGFCRSCECFVAYCFNAVKRRM